MAPRSFFFGSRRQWERAAEAVKARRLELRLSQDDAVARSGGRISRTVWSILENARQDNDQMERRSLEGASAALGWTDDSIFSIMAGGQPADRQPDGPDGGGVVAFPDITAVDLDEDAATIQIAALAGQLTPAQKARVQAYIQGLLDSDG